MHEGRVIAVRGSVIDIRFTEQLPEIFTLLSAGRDQHIIIEVQSLIDTQVVRGIALTPTEGLARGASVQNTGHRLEAPVGINVLSRMFNVFGQPIDHLPVPDGFPGGLFTKSLPP